MRRTTRTTLGLGAASAASALCGCANLGDFEGVYTSDSLASCYASLSCAACQSCGTTSGPVDGQPRVTLTITPGRTSDATIAFRSYGFGPQSLLSCMIAANRVGSSLQVVAGQLCVIDAGFTITWQSGTIVRGDRSLSATLRGEALATGFSGVERFSIELTALATRQ